MGSVKIRDVINEINQLPVPQKPNPVIEVLRREMEDQNTVLVDVVHLRRDTNRIQCKVIEVNDLYANFRQETGGHEASGAISQITVSYVAVMKMKLFTIAPIG